MPRHAKDLSEYRRRRSFDRTPEPAGTRPRPHAPDNRFVVQEHHARRLHWDLRLEHHGVLVSWALPRGFPDDPNENRLAVHTEDHPMEYLTFEDDIPSGEYGAGSMTIWDHGTFEAEKFRDDEVIVRLDGERVRARFALFRTHGKNWLIHRMDPPDPRRDPMPSDLRPMLASLSHLPADEEQWGFEIKWDGVRALAYGEPGHLRLVDRSGQEITERYPDIRGLSRQLGARHVVLDGELVALDEQGRPDFQRLQRRMHVRSEGEIRRREREAPVTYMIFDLLHLDGRSLLGDSYLDRRRALESLELSGPRWQIPAYHRGDGAVLLAASRNQGLEGIVAKRLDSTYRPGRRSRTWLKIKNVLRQDLVIGGWLPLDSHRAGDSRQRDRSQQGRSQQGRSRQPSGIDALLVGYHDDDRGFVYAGKVRAGLGPSELRTLTERLESLRLDQSPFTGGRPPARGVVFVEPQLVCVVEFTEWTARGMVRQPTYLGLRDDVPPDEVVREEPVTPVEPDRPEERHVGGRTLTLTNLDTVVYPRTGTTMRDVLDYYEAVGPVLLLHLRGRPVTMTRCPDGMDGTLVDEAECPQDRPDWVRTASVSSDRVQRARDLCVVDDLPTLLWAANRANLEFHAMLATADDLARPTTVVFDVRSGDGGDLRGTARAALWLRDLCDDLGLEVVVTTSSPTALQVLLPLNTPVSFAESKPFAQALAGLVEKHHPGDVVAQPTNARRRRAVVVDGRHNTPLATSDVPFSLRAESRPMITTPLAWDEVRDVASGRTKPDRLPLDSADVLRQVDDRARLVDPLLHARQVLPTTT
jgi:bifunctional non-homologous end joining protein LigD